MARYDNPRELAYLQLAKIFAIKSIKNSSTKGIYEFFYICNEVVRNLETLGLTRNTLVELLLIYIIQQKLDDDMRRQWELLYDDTSFPKYDKFIPFVAKQVKCTIQMPRRNHPVRNCKITKNCKICNKRHHTLLHFTQKEEVSSNSKEEPCIAAASPENTINHTSTQHGCDSTQVLLATARIHVKGADGAHYICRALLDSESQVSLITQNSCDRLGLKKCLSNRTIVGVGNQSAQGYLSSVCVSFRSIHHLEEYMTKTVVMGILTSELPNFKIAKPTCPLLKSLKLADPEFYISAPIDIILGADIYTEMILQGKFIQMMRTTNESPEQPIQDHRLLTVTYDITCAPFFAIRKVQQLAKDEFYNFPKASRAALKDFYVDDLLTGASYIQEAEELKNQMTGLMKKGGFTILKWHSNCQEIVLGLKDTGNEERIGSEEDELGRIHSGKVKARSNSFQDEIGELKKLMIPRYIINDQTSRNIQFHGFGDASRLAYSAVCYLRSETSDGRVEISLLAAKSRIAPCKNCTLPKVELCTALLLSQRYESLVESLKIHFSRHSETGDSNLFDLFQTWSSDSCSDHGGFTTDRINPSRPFLKTGVDLAGPFLLKPSLIRCISLIKSYIVIFICFSVKEIHLEIITSFSTNSFICTLRRFISRRGKPSDIYSDNGTNFKDVLELRHLVELSPDPSDLQALTPGHFLIGTSMIDIPEQRKKWRQVQNNIEVDQLVLIEEDGLPPLQWWLARVIEVYKGDDGRVRVALVKSAKGVSRRPITKVAPIPF
ncbi:hypothetical protein LAZ67_2003464 [Cordylochernes scorpioides]|uniref:DUF5641 domain-containing protein n=1 Tax=Cordylochernes scorpioides TaxID=51811 RepID=A0ABY6K2Z6_9ARAC|nr:hypothetical protein LAZ67_2003464 [Cordylochernes scorpioides]